MSRTSNRGFQPTKNKNVRTVHLPRPLKHQEPFLRAIKRFKIMAAGRRWGKTMACLIAVVAGHGTGEHKLKGALQGGDIWWVAPTYGIASLIWRELKRAMRDAWVDKREDERWILLPGGGSITVKSADNPDGLRGAGLDGAVLDECAYMKEEVWTECLRPALADKQGWAIFISTPKYEDPNKRGEGVEWFKNMYINAEGKDNWARWQRPTHDNESIPREELEELRKTMPDIAYRQEILAEFVNIGEGLFKPDWFKYYDFDWNSQTFTLETEQGIVTFKRGQLMFFCTVDLAAKKKETADYTVVATWAVTPGRQLLLIDIDRGHYTESQSKELVWKAFKKYNPSFVGIEAVGYQYAFVQEMQLGTSLISLNGAVQRIPPLPIRELHPTKDKYARALTIAEHYKTGIVFHPNPKTSTAEFLKDYEKELIAFPNPHEHDDQVDCASYAGEEISKPYYTNTEIPILICGGGMH